MRGSRFDGESLELCAVAEIMKQNIIAGNNKRIFFILFCPLYPIGASVLVD